MPPYNHHHHHRRRRSQREARSLISTTATILTTALAAYGTYKLASLAWSSWQTTDTQPKHNNDNDNNNTTLTTVTKNSKHKQTQLSKCRKNVRRAMNDFLPMLKRSIRNLTDITRLTKSLKLSKQQRNETSTSRSTDDDKRRETELWNEIKINIVLRMMMCAYAHAVLFLVLGVQIHMIGRRNSDNDDDDEDDEARYSQHQVVLGTTYRHFFSDGMKSLAQRLKHHVSTSLREWDVTDTNTMSVTFDSFSREMDRLRDSVENEVKFIQFIIREEEEDDQVNDQNDDDDDDEQRLDPQVKQLLNESWDILESPVFEYALRDCLEETFQMMKVQWKNQIFRQNESIPLATVITQLKHVSNGFFDEVEVCGNVYSNKYLPVLEKLASVLELGDASFGVFWECASG